MPGTYYRLEEAEDVLESRNLQQKTPRFSILNFLHWAIHGISLIALLALSMELTRVSRGDRLVPKGFRRLYSPLWESVVYSPRVFDHANFEAEGSTSPFKGAPRPELDNAWAKILNHSLILIDEDEMAALGQPTHNAKRLGDKYYAYVDVFHQLHCLDLVRKYIFRSFYPDFVSFQDSEQRIMNHVDHCIDIIRQKIQCDSDIDIIVYTDHSEEGRQPEARFDIEHMCRNFDDIQQWTFNHAFDA